MCGTCYHPYVSRTSYCSSQPSAVPSLPASPVINQHKIIKLSNILQIIDLKRLRECKLDTSRKLGILFSNLL